MHTLPIPYPTNQLEYGDNHVYKLSSVYCSLVYVMPILDDFSVDRIPGSRMAVILGALLIAISYVVLGASEVHPSFPYLPPTIIACGYGLLKFNVNRLLGGLYEPTDPHRDGSFSLVYVAGDVGPIITSIACGSAQEEYSWAMGFGLAAVGMIVSLVIFLYGGRHFTRTRGVSKKALHTANFLLSNWGRLLVLLVVTPTPITVLFWKEWSVYVLIVTTIIGLGALAKICRKAEN